MAQVCATCLYQRKLYCTQRHIYVDEDRPACDGYKGTDRELIYMDEDVRIIRIESYIVLISRFGFTTTGNFEDWWDCMAALKKASIRIGHIWERDSLPADSAKLPHDELVTKAINFMISHGLNFYQGDEE